jgi:hypothetical protein
MNDVPHVESQLSYLGDAVGTPTNYLDRDPPPGTPRRYPHERHAVAIYDARSSIPRLSLDRQGFVLARDAEGVIPDFHDERMVMSAYYRAAERLVQRLTGAGKVLVFDHTHRSSSLSQRAADGTDTAVDEVHNDYTARSGPERAREMLRRFAPHENATQLAARRFAIFNIWRPTNGVVEQKPLAICDMQTMQENDFVDAELQWPHRTGYVCAVRYSPAHRWYYFPRQESYEVTVFKCYDSAPAEGAGFGAHTAFEDPSSSPAAKARESLELRALAFF